MLGESAWYFRDSNWDPHFPTISAERASWFLNKGLGVNVDGVLTLPTTAFETILDTTGPLTTNNTTKALLQKCFRTTNFHAGSWAFDQVKNYPSAVLDAFFQRILEGQARNLLTYFPHFPLFSDGEVQLNSPTSQSKLNYSNFAGLDRWLFRFALDNLCKSTVRLTPCIKLESNVGVNRVNTKVERDIHEDVSCWKMVKSYTKELQTN